MHRKSQDTESALYLTRFLRPCSPGEKYLQSYLILRTYSPPTISPFLTNIILILQLYAIFFSFFQLFSKFSMSPNKKFHFMAAENPILQFITNSLIFFNSKGLGCCKSAQSIYLVQGILLLFVSGKTLRNSLLDQTALAFQYKSTQRYSLGLSMKEKLIITQDSSHDQTINVIRYSQ